MQRKEAEPVQTILLIVTKGLTCFIHFYKVLKHANVLKLPKVLKLHEVLELPKVLERPKSPGTSSLSDPNSHLNTLFSMHVLPIQQVTKLHIHIKYQVA
jgi:hypothetical protein